MTASVLQARAAAQRVALLVDDRSSGLPTWVHERWPDARLVCIVPSKALRRQLRRSLVTKHRILVVEPGSVSVRHSALSAYGPFHVIIDPAQRTVEDRVATVRAVFLHLRSGGVYLTVEHVAAGGDHPDLVELITCAAEQDPLGDAVATAFGEIGRKGRSVSLMSTVNASPKLRYREVDDVLRRRPALGSVLSTRPALISPSRAHVIMNRDQPPVPLVASFRVPSLGIREYKDVVCAPYQVLTSAGMLLPDSYRHYLNRTLTHRMITDVSERFARRKRLRVSAELPGPHFYLGSAFPQHFGHVITEQLSRLWAWEEVKDRYPMAKAIVDLRKRHDALQPWEIDMFTAAGVAKDDLVGVKGAVRVERLLAATPMLVNTQYVHPDITEIWARTARNLVAAAPERDYPDRIFVSRRQTLKNRRCRNASEVESFFVDHGFTVLYPEDHSVPEQAALFCGASTIAGFAGSNLFSLCFCEPKQVIMLWPDTYTSRNEYLICSAAGHELSIFWCTPDVEHPANEWQYAAYQSTYSFDFERDGALLAQTLRRVG